MRCTQKNKARQIRNATIFGVLMIFIFAIFLFVNPALAQQESLEAFGEATRLPQTSVPVIIAQIIRAVLGVVGIIGKGGLYGNPFFCGTVAYVPLPAIAFHTYI